MRHKEVLEECDRCHKCSFREKLYGFVCNYCNKFFDGAIYIVEDEDE